MEWMKPMEPLISDVVVKKKEWIHQVKWDGIRGLCYIEPNRIHLYTRSGRERLSNYPEILGIKKQMNCQQAVLDGELIVPDPKGRPSFYLVMSRERLKKQERILRYQQTHPVQYMVFDMLYKDGVDLRKLPLKDRTKILCETLSETSVIQVVSSYRDGEALFLKMKEKGLEGIVSKNLNSPYIAGKKHREWFKTKIVRQLLAVVCGLNMKENSVKSLILGVYREKTLYPVGSVSSGLSHKDREVLKQALPKLKRDTSPFHKKIHDRDVIWIQPVLTVLVRFLEKEPSGGLRHPVLIGFTSRVPFEADGEEETV